MKELLRNRGSPSDTLTDMKGDYYRSYQGAPLYNLLLAERDQYIDAMVRDIARSGIAVWAFRDALWVMHPRWLNECLKLTDSSGHPVMTTWPEPVTLLGIPVEAGSQYSEPRLIARPYPPYRIRELVPGELLNRPR